MFVFILARRPGRAPARRVYLDCKLFSAWQIWHREAKISSSKRASERASERASLKRHRAGWLALSGWLVQLNCLQCTKVALAQRHWLLGLGAGRLVAAWRGWLASNTCFGRLKNVFRPSGRLASELASSRRLAGRTRANHRPKMIRGRLWKWAGLAGLAGEEKSGAGSRGSGALASRRVTPEAA